MENNTRPSILASRDLVQHYHKKSEDVTKAVEAMRCKLAFLQGNLANEKRMRRWLEAKLDKVMRALESQEAIEKYRDEYQVTDEIRCIIELTNDDIENEKRLQKKLQETKEVMQRAKEVAEYKQNFEKYKKVVCELKDYLETAQWELDKETEIVKVLEQTIADVEQPLTYDLVKRQDKEDKKEQLQRLECLTEEFLGEVKVRQRDERELVELEEAMSRTRSETKMKEYKEAENAVALERTQKELAVERNLREQLERKLANMEGQMENKQTEQSTHQPSIEEDNMLKNFLKCTLDKLSNETKERRVLEEKLAGLERTVERGEAKLKFEKVFLKLTQKELEEEKEARENLEKQLAEQEKRASEDAKMAIESEEGFDARLDELDRILTNIQEQNGYKDGETDKVRSEIDGGQESEQPDMNITIQDGEINKDRSEIDGGQESEQPDMNITIQDGEINKDRSEIDGGQESEQPDMDIGRPIQESSLECISITDKFANGEGNDTTKKTEVETVYQQQMWNVDTLTLEEKTLVNQLK